MVKRLHLHVRGRVQGVFYRKSTKEKATELGIVGFVQNEPDGSVVCEAEGDEHILEAFVDWMKTGPPMAEVRELLRQELDPEGDVSFEIIR